MSTWIHERDVVLELSRQCLGPKYDRNYQGLRMTDREGSQAWDKCQARPGWAAVMAQKAGYARLSQFYLCDFKGKKCGEMERAKPDPVLKITLLGRVGVRWGD